MVGSSIANIGLSLGVAVLIAPAPVDGALRARELPVLSVATAGNVLGSNIFNVFFCLGASALAGRVGAPLREITIDLIALGVMTALVAMLVRGERTISRAEGAVAAGLQARFVAVPSSGDSRAARPQRTMVTGQLRFAHHPIADTSQPSNGTRRRSRPLAHHREPPPRVPLPAERAPPGRSAPNAAGRNAFAFLAR